MNRGLGGPQSPSQGLAEEKNPSPQQEIAQQFQDNQPTA